MQKIKFPVFKIRKRIIYYIAVAFIVLIAVLGMHFHLQKVEFLEQKIISLQKEVNTLLRQIGKTKKDYLALKMEGFVDDKGFHRAML